MFSFLERKYVSVIVENGVPYCVYLLVYVSTVRPKKYTFERNEVKVCLQNSGVFNPGMMV